MWVAPREPEQNPPEQVPTPLSGGYNRGHEILINDTIGFIRDLPPELIQAFASTLEDSIESDLLLHVIDASDPKCEEKIGIVEDMLEAIHAEQPRLYVFNKIDLVPRLYLTHLAEKFADFAPIFISAEQKLGIEELKQIIAEELE